MNILIGAVGSGLGFVGSLFLLVDVFPVLWNPKKVAEQEHDEAVVEAIQGTEFRKLVKAPEIKAAALRRGRYYRAGAILLALGFLLQTLGVLV